jgi:hypothetical protein
MGWGADAQAWGAGAHRAGGQRELAVFLKHLSRLFDPPVSDRRDEGVVVR